MNSSSSSSSCSWSIWVAIIVHSSCYNYMHSSLFTPSGGIILKCDCELIERLIEPFLLNLLSPLPPCLLFPTRLSSSMGLLTIIHSGKHVYTPYSTYCAYVMWFSINKLTSNRIDRIICVNCLNCTVNAAVNGPMNRLVNGLWMGQRIHVRE